MYEWEVTLYYDKDKNVFTNDDGDEIENIFSIISPNMMYLFKTKKQDMLVYGVSGHLIGLIYP